MQNSRYKQIVGTSNIGTRIVPVPGSGERNIQGAR